MSVGFSSSAVSCTMLPSGTGTRHAKPSSFPFSDGMTSATAFAAPVVVGIIETAALRALRKSLCGASTSLWSAVYACAVTMNPLFTPKLSCNTLTIGARQFVVQLAFDIMLCLFLLYSFSFTPFTIVMSGSFDGDDIRTFFAPALMCCIAPALSVKNPVLSTTTSIFNSFHGSFVGSFSANTLIVLPLTIKFFSSHSTGYGDFPWTES